MRGLSVGGDAASVFMPMQDGSAMGQPFTQRSSFMPALRRQIGIPPMASMPCATKVPPANGAEGLQDAQRLLGHSSASTTGRAVKSDGLYVSQEAIAGSPGRQRRSQGP